MTEDEHIALSEAGTEFCRKLALLTASVVVQFPDELRDDVIYYLQDQTSLFSPFTADLIMINTQMLRKT